MDCERWMTAISAQVDGEETGIDDRMLAAHLESCPACRSFRDGLQGLRRRTLVGEAPEMPDLSRRVAKLNAISERASRWGIVRVLLAVVAIEVLVISMPALLFGEGESASAHAARHLGAFAVAYAVTLLIVVIRPARARSIFPVTMVLAGALVVSAVIDTAQGRIPLLGEALHVPELISVLLVWLLARPTPVGHKTRRVAVPDQPFQPRVVDHADESDVG
jgi:predicted anti-sigma-YlaC factor YlaD